MLISLATQHLAANLLLRHMSILGIKISCYRTQHYRFAYARTLNAHAGFHLSDCMQIACKVKVALHALSPIGRELVEIVAPSLCWKACWTLVSDVQPETLVNH